MRRRRRKSSLWANNENTEEASYKWLVKLMMIKVKQIVEPKVKKRENKDVEKKSKTIT